MVDKTITFWDRFLKSPFKLKIFFSFIFIFFAVIIAVITFLVNYNYEQKYIKDQIHEEAISFIQNRTDYLKSHIDKYKFKLNSLSSNGIFKNYIQEKEGKEEVIALFENDIASDKNIMQIRYIDKEGMEKVRLQRTQRDFNYEIVEDSTLQNKKDRYYFKEIAAMGKVSGVWTSDIDLNIEHGKIQKPYVPTLRFGVPVYHKESFEGILILNIFMEGILDHITKEDLFIVSLMDKEGEFLIGYHEYDGRLLDYSWSKYLLKKIDIKNFASREYIEQFLSSYEFDSELYHSKQINLDVGLKQKIVMILKIKSSKIKQITRNNLHKIFDTLTIVLLLSGPIGFLLAYIPSLLSSKVFNATRKLDEKSMIFDEYLEAMNVNNIISKSDKEGRITYVNDNFCKVSGYTKDEVIGKPHSLLRDPKTPKETFKILWLTIQSGKVWKGILRNRKKNGGFYDVDIAIMPIFNTKKEIVEYLAVRHDITELMEQRKNLINIATKDQLTGFGNRYKLNLDIKEHFVNNIAVIDIDKFAAINDFYGHILGDEIIQKFSELIKEALTDEFQLYRLHSDKFAIHNFTLDTTRFVNYMEHLNTKMIESVIETDIESFDIVTTTGISTNDNETIISTAEIANKYAKEINKKVLVYTPELDIEKVYEQNIIWTQKVKKALLEDRIIIHYQPIYNMASQKTEKYEVLVRLLDEDGSIVTPFYFLDVAKSSGQYIDITKTVIRKSFEKFKDLDVEFSINLTIEDILDEELCNYLETMIAEYRLSKKLVIEIVESEGINEFNIVQNFIKRLKFLGCKIAIDDFGTGYSNFEYLVKLEPDFIKIDGSMIKNINSDENMKEIVKTIIEFAKKMDYLTIGEFVASKEILHTIQKLGIDYAQGYYIGAPDGELRG
jgi:PAS domain S-box-containing protein/diguanylate cyclase (GGDEF)-like protein